MNTSNEYRQIADELIAEVVVRGRGGVVESARRAMLRMARFVLDDVAEQSSDAESLRRVASELE